MSAKNLFSLFALTAILLAPAAPALAVDDATESGATAETTAVEATAADETAGDEAAAEDAAPAEDDVRPVGFFGRFFEKVDLALTFDPAKKAEKEMTFAERRLAELQAKVDAGEVDPAAVEDAVARFDELRARAETRLENLPEEARAAVEQNFAEREAARTARLEKISEKLPEQARDRVVEVQERNLRRFAERVENLPEKARAAIEKRVPPAVRAEVKKEREAFREVRADIDAAREEMTDEDFAEFRKAAMDGFRETAAEGRADFREKLAEARDAAPGERGKLIREIAPGAARRDEMRDRMDKNDDGKIDDTERERAAEVREKMDRNDDGKIQPREIRADRRDEMTGSGGMPLRGIAPGEPHPGAPMGEMRKEIRDDAREKMGEMRDDLRAAETPEEKKKISGAIREEAKEIRHEVREKVGEVKNEIREKTAEIKDRMDHNDDGKVQPREAERAKEIHDRVDANDDGKIQKVEADHARDVREKMDKNDDGRVDRREVEKAREVRSDRRENDRDSDDD